MTHLPRKRHYSRNIPRAHVRYPELVHGLRRAQTTRPPIRRPAMSK